MTLSFQKFIPRIYKKSLYIGNLRLFRFTKEYTKKFLHKAVWYVVIAVFIISMIFGSLAVVFSGQV
jgi:hypothetical protein